MILSKRHLKEIYYYAESSNAYTKIDDVVLFILE